MAADQQGDYKVPFSRSMNGRTPSGYSRISSVSTVDTKNVHVYLRRQSSRTSLTSSASGGPLITSDPNSISSASRPVSADTPNTIINGPSSSSTNNNNSTTRFVLPRGLPPALTAPITRSTSIPSLAARRRSSYLDKLVCRVCDYLYMGGIEAAYNANLLCRLNIEYVIDISNVEPMKVPRQKRSDCPCLCPLTTAHSRVRMTILIDENSTLDLLPYFDDVNRFIDSARSCNKSVLVHSYHGRNRCAALVVQYLMKLRRFNLERAIDALRGLKSDVEIKENFLKSLRKWESILHRSRTGGGGVGDGGTESSDRKINDEPMMVEMENGRNGDGNRGADADDRDRGVQQNEQRPFIGPFTNNRFVHGTPGQKRSAWI